jgi:pentatricopeptide repeat protein
VGTLAQTRISNLRVPLSKRQKAPIAIPNRKDLLDGNKNPVAALQNALKIGSPLDVYKLYGVVHHSSLVSSLTPEDVFSIIQKAGGERFSFLGGLRAFEFALSVRKDYIASGRTPTLDMELEVIKTGKSVAYNSLHIVLQHVQDVLNSPTGAGPGAKEQILTLLFGFKFDISQLEWLFAKMVAQNLDVGDAFLQMMNAYSSTGNVSKSEKIYHQMQQQGLATSTDHLLALIYGFATLGDVVQTRKYIQLLPDDKEAHKKGLKYLILCYAERGLQSDAIQAYREYRRNGYPTSSFLYEQMIKSCISTTDTKGVLKFFHKTNGFKSMGMYTQLVKGLLAANSSVTAWKSVREALVQYTDRNRTRRVHVPSEMAEALVQDLEGKHIDYFRDRVKLVNLPLEHRTQLISKMIYFASEPLAEVLYQQFEKGICELAQTPVQATLNYMHVLSKDAKNSQKTQELFESCIDISFSREVDLYSALLHSKQEQSEIQRIFEDMEKHNLQINGDMIVPLVKGLGQSKVLELVKSGKIPVRKGELDTDLIPLTF